MAEGTDPTATVSALARYLRANPHASDTVEGIRLWWLAPGVEITMEQLQTVLGWLQEQGVVEELRAADGRRRYRRIGGDAQLDALLGDASRG
jgi:Fe2+ or Zn2+ uptake regulation protein